jgi:hypothetical protein
MKRSPARTHTYPVCRTPIHKACQHRRLWAYHHSRLTDTDIRVVATALGVTENALIETCLRGRAKDSNLLR